MSALAEALIAAQAELPTALGRDHLRSPLRMGKCFGDRSGGRHGRGPDAAGGHTVLTYIDAGDRVVVKSDGNPTGFGGQDLTAHRGEHGIVLSNDGWGCCRVRLDSGAVVSAWNGADLEREDVRM